MVSAPICLAGERRKGTSLAPAPLTLLQMLHNIKAKPDLTLKSWVLQKQRLNHLQRSRAGDKTTSAAAPLKRHPPPPKAGGSKTDQVFPPEVSPATTGWGGCSGATQHADAKISSYWHHDAFSPLGFPQNESVFTLSLCNTSAPQAGPICSAKRPGHTSTLPTLPTLPWEEAARSEHSPVVPRSPGAPRQPPRPHRSMSCC